MHKHSHTHAGLHRAGTELVERIRVGGNRAEEAERASVDQMELMGFGNIGEVHWGGVQSQPPRKNSCDSFGAKWWPMKPEQQDPRAEGAAVPGF